MESDQQKSTRNDFPHLDAFFLDFNRKTELFGASNSNKKPKPNHNHYPKPYNATHYIIY